MPTNLPAPPARGLEPCLGFECFIADFMSALMSTSADTLDGYIRDGLERIAEQTRAEQSSLARFSEDGGSLTVTHSSGAPAIPTSLGTDLCWYREQLGQGRCLRLNQLPDDLPARATAERNVFRKTRMQSHVAVPLINAGRVWGVIGLATFLQHHEWTDEDIRQLRLTGEMIMAAVLRHELEAAARRQRDELIHVARLATLSDLTVTLTHELNQPLTAIRANAQATQRLLARGAHAENLDDVLSDIVADATRSADLIRRLDALLRRRQLEQTPVNVNQAVRDIQAIARMEAQRRGATLVLQLAPDLPDVTGDSVQLQQVLLNLVRNAAEAMATIEPDARQVVVTTSLTAPDQITVSVRDAGPSLDDAVFSRLFTHFYTTKPDGLGMGLAISRSIVEAHGGRLRGERHAGGGLVMRFTLPAATSPSPPRRPTAEDAVSQRSRRE
jgi:C4-dicarboxylate-specific signal transduction histidine kinase